MTTVAQGRQKLEVALDAEISQARDHVELALVTVEQRTREAREAMVEGVVHMGMFGDVLGSAGHDFDRANLRWAEALRTRERLLHLYDQCNPTDHIGRPVL